MGKVIITHEFDSYEEAYEINRLLNLNESHSLLWEIDQEIRSKLKYGEEKWLEDEDVQDFLDKIRDMIAESGILRNE